MSGYKIKRMAGYNEVWLKNKEVGCGWTFQESEKFACKFSTKELAEGVASSYGGAEVVEVV